MQPIVIPEGLNALEAVYWVDTPSGFAQAVDLLTSTASHTPKLLALDTEFERTQTYHPQAALMQISDGKQVFLVDLTQFLDVKQVPATFLDLLSHSAYVKIMHAGREDLELIAHLWGVDVTPFFDTQWAADFVFDGFQLGLGALVNRICQVSLAKAQTRSNWLMRPLSQEQLEYATLDVAYLTDVYHALESRLRSLNLLDWVREDFGWIYDDLEVDPLIKCRWLPDSWTLSAQQYQCLHSLVSWRHQFVMKADIPKRWAVSDQELVHLCSNKFAGIDALKAWLGPTLGKRYQHIQHIGEEISTLFDLLQRPGMGSVSPIAPLYLESKPLLQCLKDHVEREAQCLGWPPNRLSRKKWLVSWLRLFLDSQLNQTVLERTHMSRVWYGWRGDRLHQAFLSGMASMSVQVNLALAQLEQKRGDARC